MTAALVVINIFVTAALYGSRVHRTNSLKMYGHTFVVRGIHLTISTHDGNRLTIDATDRTDDLQVDGD